MEKPIEILIVDDEPDIRMVIRIALQSNGYDVAEAGNGAEAVSYMAAHRTVDLVILDIMMPVLSGIDACAEIRRLSQAPILFLTAKTMEQDKLEAYNCGGDDFLSKPFSQAELLMKVRSLTRRYLIYKGKPEGMASVSENIFLDEKNRAVLKNSQALDVTDTEFQIFSYLTENRGAIISARQLYEAVWHEKFMPSSTNTVMVHILNLRKKLEDDPANPKIIKTVWGKGYRID